MEKTKQTEVNNYMIAYWLSEGKQELKHSYLRIQLAQRIKRERKEKQYALSWNQRATNLEKEICCV